MQQEISLYSEVVLCVMSELGLIVGFSTCYHTCTILPHSKLRYSLFSRRRLCTLFWTARQQLSLPIQLTHLLSCCQMAAFLLATTHMLTSPHNAASPAYIDFEEISRLSHFCGEVCRGFGCGRDQGPPS